MKRHLVPKIKAGLIDPQYILSEKLSDGREVTIEHTTIPSNYIGLLRVSDSQRRYLIGAKNLHALEHVLKFVCARLEQKQNITQILQEIGAYNAR